MKTLKETLYESILDVEDNLAKTTKNIQKQVKNYLTYDLTGEESVSYMKFYDSKDTLKVDKGHELYIDAMGGVPYITAQNKKFFRKQECYLTIENLKTKNIYIDADIFVDLSAIDAGCVLSDLNLTGKNHQITIQYDDDDPITKKGHKLIKKFFNINPDPSTILKFRYCDDWSGTFLRDPLANKFAAVNITPTFMNDAEMSDIYNCQVKILMVTNCSCWARIKNDIFAYKPYFAFLNAKKRKTTNKSSSVLEKIFKKFLSDNPKTKLLVKYYSDNMEFSGWEHIYLKDNELEIDNISGEHPWVKI